MSCHGPPTCSPLLGGVSWPLPVRPSVRPPARRLSACHTGRASGRGHVGPCVRCSEKSEIPAQITFPVSTTSLPPPLGTSSVYCSLPMRNTVSTSLRRERRAPPPPGRSRLRLHKFNRRQSRLRGRRRKERGREGGRDDETRCGSYPSVMRIGFTAIITLWE